jgi:hypothetical protein
MSKVLAINGSPNRERGNTALVLGAFLDGMVEGGADVDQVIADRLDVRPCTGELACWNRTPGRCHIRDDMQSLYPRLAEADVWVLATPVYVPLPGRFQDLLNRVVALMDPVLETRDGRTRARTREGVRLRQVVLVATSGWWELDNLGTVVRIATELAEDFSVEFAGSVLRPHSALMRQGGKVSEQGMEVLRAARRAGRQLAEWGYMSTETLEAVRAPLVGQEEFLGHLNRPRVGAPEAPARKAPMPKPRARTPPPTRPKRRSRSKGKSARARRRKGRR